MDATTAHAIGLVGAGGSVSGSGGDPALETAWLAYSASCRELGVRDLAGLDLASVAPFVPLNQFQRDQLAISRSVAGDLAPFRLWRSAVEMAEKNICPSCWLVQACCMCPALREFKTRHKVLVLMHHREWPRGSNTGKLAVRAAAATSASASSATTDEAEADMALASSALVQTDIPAQMSALLALCEHEPLNTVVLFPSDESITMDEFVQKRGWTLPDANNADRVALTDATTVSASSASTSTPCPPLNIILLDGTWRQARSMKYLLPKHIPALRIDPFKYKLDGTLRPASAQPPTESSVQETEEADADESALLDDVAELAVDDASSASPAAASATAPLTSPTAQRKKLDPRDPVHLHGKVAPPPASSPAGGESPSNAPTFVSLFYPLRKQSQPDRISTIEALIILLMDLREPDEVTYRLLDLLRILVDSMRVQSGMHSVYGTYTKEESRAMRMKVTRGNSASDVLVGGIGGVVVGPKGRVVAVSSSPSSADGSSEPTIRVTRKQRAQRTTAMRPCMQWNRGLATCATTPCRFAHMCMLCNGDHRANDGCSAKPATAATVAAAASSSKPTTTHTDAASAPEAPTPGSH